VAAKTPTGMSTTELLQFLQDWETGSGASFFQHVNAGDFSKSFSAKVQTQLKQSGYSETQIRKLLNAQPSAFQRIINSIGGSAIPFPIGAGAAAAGGTAAAEGGADAAAAGATAGGAAGLAGSVAQAITSPLDFLMFIAWIFHPRNVLRGVEFLTGMVLMGFGIWAAFQARGESREGYSTGEIALSRSGLGRVSRALTSKRTNGGTRIESAPHRTRREALRQRYTREEQVRRRSKGKK